MLCDGTVSQFVRILSSIYLKNKMWGSFGYPTMCGRDNKFAWVKRNLIYEQDFCSTFLGRANRNRC